MFSGVVVKGVLVLPVWRVWPLPVPLYSRAVETVDRCPNHVSAAFAKDDRQFVGRRRLARGVWPVDRDTTERMGRVERIDQQGQSAK